MNEVTKDEPPSWHERLLGQLVRRRAEFLIQGEVFATIGLDVVLSDPAASAALGKTLGLDGDITSQSEMVVTIPPGGEVGRLDLVGHRLVGGESRPVCVIEAKIHRVATLSADGQPDVVPVAFEFDGAHFWIGGSGASVLATRKFRNVLAGNREVALVVDDMVSFDPFIVRGIRVYGQAEGPVERVGMVGPGTYLGITPAISWSWNLEGEPVGATWYESRRTVHPAVSAAS